MGRALATVGPENPAHVSAISLWEIANLVLAGRMSLDRPLRPWLDAAVAAPLVDLVPISPAIAAEVGALPAEFDRDPADRIIVATARVLGLTLLTADAGIHRAAACRLADV